MTIVNYGPASKYYDLFGSKDDIDFYRQLAVTCGRKALELGVGTGRVAIELAKVGVSVLGIDNSKYMLNVAKEKLKTEKTYIRKLLRLKLGDMRSFKLRELFPFVYMASSTFEHCITEQDRTRCLKSIFNVLKTRGTLAFDISQLGDEKPLNNWWIDRHELNAEEEVVRTIFSRRNPETNIASLNLFFDLYENGRMKERHHEYGEARLSSKEEIEEMLENVGFSVCEIYSDFNKSTYTKRSPTIIFIAAKP